MDNKLLFIVILVLIFPFIEITIEMSTKQLGSKDINDLLISNNNIFRANLDSECLKSWKENHKMPSSCYINASEDYRGIMNLERPHRASLDYFPQRSRYQMLSSMNNIVVQQGLKSLWTEWRHCYTEQQLIEKGYNLSVRGEGELRFESTEEYEDILLKSRSTGISTNFDFTKMPIHGLVINHKLLYKENNKNTYALPLIVQGLAKLDRLGKNARQMFEDNCTSFWTNWFGSNYSEVRTGLSAKQVRRQYAEFFRESFERIEFFEDIIDRGVKEDIFYLSYYPGYNKVWVIAKIPKNKINKSKVLIDKKEYDYDFVYPFFYVDANLSDGRHTLEIKGRENYSIDFNVNKDKIWIDESKWIMRVNEVRMMIKNHYERDVIVTGVHLKRNNLQCKNTSDVLLPHNVSLVDDYIGDTDRSNYYFNDTEIRIPCNLSGYVSKKIKLDTEIHWHFVNKSEEHVINGTIYGEVED